MKIRLVLVLVMTLVIACTGCVGYSDRDYDRGGYREYGDHDRDREREMHRDRDGDRDEHRDRDRDNREHGDTDRDDHGEHR
jgi:serine/arginine repetitive matrix protein 1